MSRLFTVASDASLIEQITTARERLVIVAPGLSRSVAAALASRIRADGGPPVLAVILDIDPEVCRLGYGDIEALDLIQPALASRNLKLHTQAGVRIGLVVVDAEILVYTPTPRLIEAGSTLEQKPNAIRITEQGAADLALACGAGSGLEYVFSQEVGLETASDAVIDKTKAELQEAPPRQFDLARRERVFNYKLEFVEFSFEHFKLNSRSVPLPAELLGLEELEQRFRNTFRIFEAGQSLVVETTDPDDRNKQIKLTEKWLSDQAGLLRKKYFIPLGSSYGNLILKRLKPDFLQKVERLKKLVKIYADAVKTNMGASIEKTRVQLLETLLPRVKEKPPASWLNRTVGGKIPDEDIRFQLDMELQYAFQAVEDTFNPTVTCVFKGVNYETITNDARFRAAIERHFGHTEALKLFDEHDSAIAQQLDLPA